MLVFPVSGSIYMNQLTARLMIKKSPLALSAGGLSYLSEPSRCTEMTALNYALLKCRLNLLVIVPLGFAHFLSCKRKQDTIDYLRTDIGNRVGYVASNNCSFS